jgi:hypothetical protein
MSSTPTSTPRHAAGDMYLESTSVVLVANDVNQSIFSLPWLVNNGIVLDAELQRDAASAGEFPRVVVVPGVTSIRTARYELMALPDRVQMQMEEPDDDADAVLMRTLGKIATILSHTPFTAIGLNFYYKYEPLNQLHFATWNSSLFASPWALRYCGKGNRDRFGTTFAYDDFDGARMRVRAAVSAKPKDHIAPEVDEPPYEVKLHFNLHRDLAGLNDSRVKELSRILALWREVKLQTWEIAQSLKK